MRLTMKARKRIAEAIAGRYRKAGKKESRSAVRKECHKAAVPRFVGQHLSALRVRLLGAAAIISK